MLQEVLLSEMTHKYYYIIINILFVYKGHNTIVSLTRPKLPVSYWDNVKVFSAWPKYICSYICKYHIVSYNSLKGIHENTKTNI